MLLNSPPVQQNNQQSAKWYLIAIIFLACAGLLIAAAIVFSLIPVYLPTKSATLQPVLSQSITLLYNFSADALHVTLPIQALSAPALLVLQNNLQNTLNAASATAGATISVVSAKLNDVSSVGGGQGKRRRQTTFIQLTVVARVKYPKTCNTKLCQSLFLIKLIIVSSGVSTIDISQLQEAILGGATTTTTATTATSTTSTLSTSTITTTFVTLSGVTISFSANPRTTTIAGRRRRRNFIQSTEITSYMPIGGCLIIGSQKDDINAAQHLYKQNAFFKHLPLGVKVMPAVDGQQINLYTFMQENKLSKATYNQLVTQDRLVHGHHLTLGALGCLEAHVHAWERVIEVNRPMLILEDDTHFDKELFDYILPYVLYSLPTNFSLLYFGNLVGEDMQSKLLDYNDFLWKVNGSNWGTYAYLISPQAAATLLDFIYPVYAQVDSMIIDIAQSQSFDVYMSKQILVKTDNRYNRFSRTQRYIIPPIIIPRIFHFIWLSNDSLPINFFQNLKLWKKFHPNWQIRLWTNESIHNSNLNIYNKHRLNHSARGLRQASDIIRYEIIYQYGGIYVDIDFEPLKNIESLLHGVEAFVVHENSHFICNGIYGAIPAHELSKRLVFQLESNWKNCENGTVNQQTGPYHMTKQVEEMQKEQKTSMKNRFQIFAPHIFFPYTWYEKDHGHPYDPSAFAVHHFRSLAELERNAIERT